jgi:hypothetical protein
LAKLKSVGLFNGAKTMTYIDDKQPLILYYNLEGLWFRCRDNLCSIGYKSTRHYHIYIMGTRSPVGATVIVAD